MENLPGVFDALISAAGHCARIDGLRSKARSKDESGRACCGHCNHWMKSRQCPKERNVNGYSRGPSMNGLPCSLYAEDPAAEAYRQEARALRAEADAMECQED